MTDMYICLCNAVKKSTIEETIRSGITTLEGLQDALEVNMNCGACECDVIQILESFVGNDNETNPESERQSG